MILNPNGDQYYSVGNETFQNPLLMMQASKATGQEPVYHFFDEIIDTMDWSVDYTKTHQWETLLNQRALELRRKYKKLRIWFSGGRDSFLVLKTFLLNGIFIDEIAVIDFAYTGCEFPFIMNWLRQNKHLLHKDTQVKEYRSDESVFYKRVKGNWAEHPTLSGISPVLTIGEIQRHMMNKENPDNTAEISGFEKPRVFKGLMDDSWTQYYNDQDSKFWMGVVEHEPFFMSKTVPLFEYNTHHLINYIEDVVMPKYQIINYEEINTNFFKTVGWIEQNGIRVHEPAAQISPYYEDFCKASLRTEFAHIFTGNPILKLQHASPDSTRIGTQQYAEIEQRLDPELMSKLKDGVMIADSMYEEFYQHGNPIYNTKPIYSKFHPIK